MKVKKAQKRCLKGFDIHVFLSDLETLRRKYHIAVIDKFTSDIDARRIAILVTNSYLANDGSVYHADLIERKIYEAVKLLGLSCDPIPEERRIARLRGRNRKKYAIARYSPLRLGIEGKGEYLKAYTPLIYLIVDTLNRREVI